MTKTSETIVFFGSGPVAAKSLELLAKNFTVEAVITKPQPAHHKEAFPVLVTAKGLGLKVFTPNSRQELSELFATKPVTSKVGVVIDYGFIINKDVIDYFPLGIVNSHFSVLPEWRGADPISFAILSGQQKTGVSLMLIVEKMDEGELISYGEQPLDGTETTPELTEKLILLSDALLQHYLPQYMAGELETAPQSVTGRAVSYSRKLTKDDGILDFARSAIELEREVRAYADWPKSRTKIGDKDIVVTKAHVIDGSGTPGKIWKEAKQFGFYTTDGIFVIDSLKPAGKAGMPALAFLAGYASLLND